MKKRKDKTSFGVSLLWFESYNETLKKIDTSTRSDRKKE